MMAIPETSREAWRDLIASGVCTKKQQLAWNCLHEFGPATAMEVCAQTRTHGLWKRLSELRSLGLVEERPARQCRITKRKATVWFAMPVGSVKRVEEPKARTFWLVRNPEMGWYDARTSNPWDNAVLDISPDAEVIEVREVKR